MLTNNFIKKLLVIKNAIVITTMAFLFLSSCNLSDNNKLDNNNVSETNVTTDENKLENKLLVIYNSEGEEGLVELAPTERAVDNRLYNSLIYAEYPVTTDACFSIEFIHSVNKSPVVEYYKVDKDNNIYVYKTIYYNYGAGVPTELNKGEHLSYGDDGSMIIDGIDKKIDNLTYYLSDIYDHTLIIRNNDEKEKFKVSLWDVCGKNKIITFKVTDK